MDIELPGRLPDARNHTFVSELAETDTADAEITHERVAAATLETAVLHAGAELLLLLRACDD